jgi:hypothetical protein
MGALGYNKTNNFAVDIAPYNQQITKEYDTRGALQTTYRQR